MLGPHRSATNQIDELLLPAGIDLPEEARVWWRWHNGTRDDAPVIARDFARRQPLSLVVDAYEHQRATDVELYGLDGLLRPISEMPVIYFDCSGPRDAPVPIYSLNDWTDDARLALSSIGDLVLTWISLIDRGVWVTRPDGTWAWDHERIPQDVLQNGIY